MAPRAHPQNESQVTSAVKQGENIAFVRILIRYSCHMGFQAVNRVGATIWGMGSISSAMPKALKVNFPHSTT
jgi:hypothetical protein